MLNLLAVANLPRLIMLGSIIILEPNTVLADDLRTTYIWTYARTEGVAPPKLGLQSRNPKHRTQDYERLMITCDKSKKLSITAWPVDLRERAPEPNMDMNFATDNTRHLLPNPKRAFNEMEEAWEVEAISPDLQPVKGMIGAKSVRLGVTGISMALPKANSAVSLFLDGCEKYSR